MAYGSVQDTDGIRGSSRVKEFVGSCLDQATTDSVKVISAQGGYFEPANFIVYGGLKVGYGFDKGNQLPTKEELENQLSDTINRGLLSCINDFEVFDEPVEFESPITEVVVSDDKIFVKTMFPVIIRGEVTGVFFSEPIIPLGLLHMIAHDVVNMINGTWIDLSALSLYDAKVKLIPLDDNVLYTISKDNLVYSFAVKFEKNSPPTMELPDRIKIQDGSPWLYKVDCFDPDDDEVNVWVDTTMIDMLPDGTILTTIEIPGDYLVTFSCSDGLHETKESVWINVHE